MTIHDFSGQPPHRTFPVISISAYISSDSGKQVPMQMDIPVAQKLIVHLFRIECFGCEATLDGNTVTLKSKLRGYTAAVFRVMK